MKSWLKKTFVPHEENNHHPHFWRDNSLAVLLALILLSELAVFSQSALVFNKDSYLAAVLPAVLASLTNQERVQASGAPALAENELLRRAAEAKAQDMASKGYFSHNSPEGYLPWHWLDKVGYTYAHAGENLAVNFTDSKDVVDAWMNSPTHRANIVKQVYTETGIGMAEGEYQGKHAIFVAQFFGTPVKKAAAPVVPPPAPTVVSQPVAVTATPTPVATTPVAGVSVSVTPKPAPKPVAQAPAPIMKPGTSSSTFVATVAPTSTAASNTPTVEGAQLDTIVLEPSFTQSLLASPRHAGTAVMSIILGVIIAAFLLILLVNGKVHHPRITLMMVSFLVIVVGILVLNTRLLRDNVIVGDNTPTSSSVTL